MTKEQKFKLLRMLLRYLDEYGCTYSDIYNGYFTLDNLIEELMQDYIR